MLVGRPPGAAAAAAAAALGPRRPGGNPAGPGGRPAPAAPAACSCINRAKSGLCCCCNRNEKGIRVFYSVKRLHIALQKNRVEIERNLLFSLVEGESLTKKEVLVLLKRCGKLVDGDKISRRTKKLEEGEMGKKGVESYFDR